MVGIKLTLTDLLKEILARSGGGILKDNFGNIIAAYDNTMGTQTKNYAEALAALWGIKLDKDQNISDMWKGTQSI